MKETSTGADSCADPRRLYFQILVRADEAPVVSSPTAAAPHSQSSSVAAASAIVGFPESRARRRRP
jgi:hypothetical protein